MQTPDPHVPRTILDRTIELLEELCAISSASGDAAGVRRVAEHVGAALAAADDSVPVLRIVR